MALRNSQPGQCRKEPFFFAALDTSGGTTWMSVGVQRKATVGVGRLSFAAALISASMQASAQSASLTCSSPGGRKGGRILK